MKTNFSKLKSRVLIVILSEKGFVVKGKIEKLAVWYIEC
jgi:hypothetical protein